MSSNSKVRHMVLKHVLVIQRKTRSRTGNELVLPGCVIRKNLGDGDARLAICQQVVRADNNSAGRSCNVLLRVKATHGTDVWTPTIAEYTL